jgi:hypothetical protein
MMRYKTVFRKTDFLLIATIIGCIAPFGMTALSSRGQEVSFEERQRQKREKLKGVELRVLNLTRGLAVVKLEKHVDQDLIHVVFRNDYEKIITAYKVSVGSGTIASECLSVQETGDLVPFRPGEVREEMYPLQIDVETLGIKILAVVFDDKTSDGVPKYVQEMEEYRRGLKIGIKHALQLLDGISQLPSQEIPQALGRVRLELSPHSGGEEETLPHFARAGLRDVSARIASILARNQSALQELHWNASEAAGFKLTTIVGRLAAAVNKL